MHIGGLTTQPETSMRSSVLAVFLFLAALAGGCASGPNRSERGEESLRHGVVTRIEAVELEGDHEFGVGTLVGAAAGGVIGHQIGGGSGRGLATVLGAVGGGLAGNAIENHAERRSGQRIFTQLDGGGSISVTQPGSDLRAGDRVLIEGSGKDARVVRAPG